MATVEEIKDKKAEFDKDRSQLRVEQKKDDDFYEMRFSTGIKKPYKQLRLATPRRVVDVAAEHIATDNPLVTKEPKDITAAAQERADRIEKWGNAFLNLMLQDSLHPIQETVKNFGCRGESFIKVLPNPDYPDKPESDKGEKKADFEARMTAWEQETSMIPPVKWTFPDPMTVWPSRRRRNNIPLETFEIYKRSAADIKREFPGWKNTQSRKNDELVDFWEYYSWDERYTEADGEAVSHNTEKDHVAGVEPNILGVVPYPHYYSGLGRTSPEGKPETLARSLIFPIRDTIRAQSRAQAQLDSQITLYTHPRIITSLNEKDIEGIDLSPGQAVTGIPKDERFDIDSGVPPSSAMFVHVQNLNNEIEKFIPSPLSGGHLGAESGFQQAQQIGQGSLKFVRLKEGTEHMLESALMLTFRVISRVHMHDVILRGTIWEDNKPQIDLVKISLDDLEDFTKVKVKLEPSDPEFTDRRAILGDRLWKSGAISQRRMLEQYLSIPNASDEQIQILAEKILMTNPEILQIMGLKALEKLGMKEEAARLQAQLEAQSQTAEKIQGRANETGVVPPDSPGRVTNPNSFEAADLAIRKLSRISKQVPGGNRSRVEEPRQ